MRASILFALLCTLLLAGRSAASADEPAAPAAGDATYYLSMTLDMDLPAAKAAVTEALKVQSFAVLTEIDLQTKFKEKLGKVSYHIPCHSRVQNMGQKTREVLESIPGTEVTTVERCSGHDGTWGVKAEYFDNSMKIGRPVFRMMAEPRPDYVSSDCPIAARHIMQGIGDDGPKAKKAHPLSLLRKAYGI